MIACYAIGRHKGRSAAAAASEIYSNDAAVLKALAAPGLIGKAAVAPAQTTVVGWAVELVTDGVHDLDFLQLLAASSVYAQLSTRDGAIRVDLSGRDSRAKR